MSIFTETPFPETRWQAERGQWGSYFDGLIHTQLSWASEFVRTHKTTPHHLKPRFRSLLALLASARNRSDLYPLALDLITALHPLPMGWGYWTAWEPEMRWAIKIAASVGQTARQAEFLGYLSELQLTAGLVETAIRTGEQALELAQRADDLPSLSRAGAATIAALRLGGHTSQARELLASLKMTFARAAHRLRPAAQVALHTQLARHEIYFIRMDGRLTEALAQIDALLQGAPALAQDATLLAGVYGDRAIYHWTRGDYPHAVADLRQALALYEQMGEEVNAATTWGYLGLVYWSMAALDLAEETLQKSAALCEQLNARMRLTTEVGNLGLVYLSRGELPRAAEYISRQIELAEETGYMTERHRALGNRGIVRVHLGAYATAIEDLQADIAFAKSRGQEGLAMSYMTLSWGLLGLGRWQEGKTYAQQAVRMGEAMDSPALRTLGLRCLAEFQTGEEKYSALQIALELARNRKRRLDEAACLFSLAGCVSPAESRLFWEEGTALLRVIGATSWLVGHTPENPPRIALLL